MVSFKNLAISSLLAAAASAAPAALEKRQSSVPVGQVIYACTQPGKFAITFDDGPFQYTSDLLDILDGAGVKATFFVNGANYGNIYDYAAVVKRAYDSGHQIGSHTWSHADLATLSNDQVVSQMTQVEQALYSIIGRAPTYMRPPYLSVSDSALGVLASLGYHVISLDVDTKDYEHQDNIQIAVDNFRAGIANGGTISLEHDVHEQTVHALAAQLVSITREYGLTPVTVGECLGDAPANWYK